MIAIFWTAMCSCMLAQNTSITRESDRRVNATPGASVPWSLCLPPLTSATLSPLQTYHRDICPIFLTPRREQQAFSASKTTRTTASIHRQRQQLLHDRHSRSTVITMAELNSACCALPAVVTSNYSPKGKYEKLAGLDVCESASKPRLTSTTTQPNTTH